MDEVLFVAGRLKEALARDEHGATGGADGTEPRAGIEAVRERGAIADETIEVGGMDCGMTQRSDGIGGLIIGNYEQKIGSLLSGSNRVEQGKRKQKTESSHGWGGGGSGAN